MPKFKIDSTPKTLPGRFARPRVCQFDGCGAETTGYKWCPMHAKIVERQQKQLDQANRREINRKTHQRKRALAVTENEERLAAMKNMPPVYTSSDLLHMPADKAARVIDDILGGDAGMVR